MPAIDPDIRIRTFGAAGHRKGIGAGAEVTLLGRFTGRYGRIDKRLQGCDRFEGET